MLRVNRSTSLRPWLLLLLVVALVVTGACTKREASNSSARPSGGDSSVSVSGKVSSDQDETIGADPPGGSSSSVRPSAPKRGKNTSQFIAIGELHDKRLYAVELGELVAAAKRRETKELDVAGISRPVGSPVAAAYAGQDLVVASTNVRTLVKLVPTWDAAQEVSVADAIGSGSSRLRYGAVIPVDEGHVAVSVAFSNKLAVVVVNVPTFQVVKAKVFDDRFAGFPEMCRSDSGRLFIASTRFVDVLTPDLERVASLATDWIGIGSACVGNQAWISESDKPLGHVLNEDAKEVGTFQWDGDSSNRLIYSQQTARVYGTDQVKGIVFGCPVAGGQCATSERIGNKPTDLLAVDSHLIVALENDAAIAVLRADNLAIEGTAGFPGSPRTVIRMPV